jgi:hypothetical protein
LSLTDFTVSASVSTLFWSSCHLIRSHEKSRKANRWGPDSGWSWIVEVVDVFVLSANLPFRVQVAGLIDVFMIFMGCKLSGNKKEENEFETDSLLGKHANAGFILWLTIGTTLILNAKLFGLIGFSVFAGVHWLTDFSWYTVVALLIFKSQRLDRAHKDGYYTFACWYSLGFGIHFMSSAWCCLLLYRVL